jgi:hypothetical protein
MVGFQAQLNAEMANHQNQNQGQLQNHLEALENCSSCTYECTTDPILNVFVYINSREQMVVVKRKHQTSSPNVRGNFELAFSTLEHFRLPIVSNKRKFRTNSTVYYYKKSIHGIHGKIVFPYAFTSALSRRYHRPDMHLTLDSFLKLLHLFVCCYKESQ